MRIGLGLLHVHRGIGGIWNYIDNVLRVLARYDDANTYVGYVNDESRDLIPDKGNFHVHHLNINPRAPIQRIACENTVLQGLAKYHGIDCMHWFGNIHAFLSFVPNVVTVHDIFLYKDAHTFSLLRGFYWRLMFRHTVKNCRVLLPVSEATAEELAVVLGADREKMILTPFPMDERFRPMPPDRVEEFRTKYGLPDQFWLYVAHTYKHKNHLGLLEAYRNLKVRGFNPWPLVLRGDPSDAESRITGAIREFGLENDVIRFPRIDYFDLPLLYSCASALVFPSFFEGCGLPVLEAMACGCPVIASDIPPMREFAGEAACFFDPADVHDIERSMAELERDETLRHTLTEKGLEQVGHFDSATVARDIMKAYEIAARPR
jgi:glycosyltransferase involved in cell wall biosynthesis